MNLMSLTLLNYACYKKHLKWQHYRSKLYRFLYEKKCYSNNLCQQVMALSRSKGPAMINHAELEWFKNGIRHRDKGPSLIANNMKQFHKYGELHRLDGPAIEYKDGTGHYYIDGIIYAKSNFWNNGRVKISKSRRINNK